MPSPCCDKWETEQWDNAYYEAYQTDGWGNSITIDSSIDWVDGDIERTDQNDSDRFKWENDGFGCEGDEERDEEIM